MATRPRAIPVLSLAPTVLAVTALLAGCSSGPEMGDLEPAAFFGRFTGTWEADAGAEDRVGSVLEAQRDRPGGLGRGQPRRTGGRVGGTYDPGTIQAAMRLAGEVPDRLTLSVSDSAVTAVGLYRGTIVLRYGEKVEITAGGTEIELKAKWDGPILILERAVGPVFITDRLEPIRGGDRLVVTRRVSTGYTGGAEVAFGYDRAG